MGTIVKGGTLPDTGVTKNEIYALIDNATFSGISNADIASNAAIADTKLAQITTAGKVDGSSLTGVIPGTNPSGAIILWSGAIADIPTGYLFCNGSLVSKTTYATLYGICGTIHGAGDASNFNLPDLRDRFIVGAKADDSGVPKTSVADPAATALTQSGDGQIPSHQHALHDQSYYGGGSSGTPIDCNRYGSNTSVDGCDAFGTGTKNVAVYYALAYIIKT